MAIPLTRRRHLGRIGQLEAISLRTFEGNRLHGVYLSFFSFNQADKQAIVAGAKGRFSPEQVMTGRELCSILAIDFDVFRTGGWESQHRTWTSSLASS